MANTRFKVDNGLLVVAESGVNSDFYTLTNFRSNVNVVADVWAITGNLVVGGTINFVNTTVTGTFVPNLDQVPLGNTTNRFNAFLYDVMVYDNVMPSANAQSLGNNTSRWAGWFTTINASSTVNVGGNVAINSTALTVDATNLRVGVNTAIASLTNTFTVTGQSFYNGNTFIVGTANVTGNVVASGIKAGNTSLFSNLVAVSNTSQIIIDSYPKTQAQCAKYVVSVKQTVSGDMHAIELMFVHDNSFVYLTKYGEVFTTNLGSFDAAINSANVEIYFTAAVTNTYTISVSRIQA